jgi:hypothetical protein
MKTDAVGWLLVCDDREFGRATVIARRRGDWVVEAPNSAGDEVQSTAIGARVQILRKRVRAALILTVRGKGYAPGTGEHPLATTKPKVAA